MFKKEKENKEKILKRIDELLKNKSELKCFTSLGY